MISLLLSLALSAEPAKPAPPVDAESKAKIAHGYSVWLCYWTQTEADLERKIAEERAIGKESGVVNLSEIYGLSKQLRIAKKAGADARANLKRVGAAPLSCDSAGIPELVQCVEAYRTRPVWNQCDDTSASGWSAFRAEFLE